MIYKNIELHNVEDTVTLHGCEGQLMYRIPAKVSGKLRTGTQEMYRQAGGVEIRFVSDARHSVIRLVNYGSETKATLYFGDYQENEYMLPSNKLVEIHVDFPERLMTAIPYLPKGSFSPLVRRLIILNGSVHIIEVDGKDIRPPKRDELPALRYLAYGTSITHAYNALGAVQTYVQQTARRLRADAINLGVSGNAFCEPELADYIAEREDWDLATICISVNMLNQGVAADEFHDKAVYFVKRIASSNPKKPVVCISPFTYFLDIGVRNPEQNPVATPDEYRKALKNIAASLNLSNLKYVDGRDLMDFCGLSFDLLHPGDFGMIQIGEKLASFIESNCRLICR